MSNERRSKRRRVLVSAGIGGALGLFGRKLQATAPKANRLDLITFDMAHSDAVGDGSSDDGGKIQAFLETLSSDYGAACVELPPGKFYLLDSAPLTIPPGITIRGSYSGFGSRQNNALFLGGGFKINPITSGIIMSAASSLRNCKVYRNDLKSNPSPALVARSISIWSTEAFFLQTTHGTNDGNTLPFSQTARVTLGMAVSGPGIPYGTTVNSVKINTSVTLSNSIFTPVRPDTYIRFGPSIGINIPPNQSGVVLENLTIIGFRTGIQCQSGQFFAERIHSDCITNFEGINSGDTAHIRSWECAQWYGEAMGSPAPPRPGDLFFYHDAGITYFTEDVFCIGWLVGFHLQRAQGAQLYGCNAEGYDGASITGFFLDEAIDTTLYNCLSSQNGTGFHVKNSAFFQLANCRSAGGPSNRENAVAHFLIEGPTSPCYGAIISPLTNGGAGMSPFTFKRGIAKLTFSSPTIINNDMPAISGDLPPPFLANIVAGVHYSAPASGDHIVIPTASNELVVDGSRTLETLTITLPPHPVDGQSTRMRFDVAVARLAVRAADGGAVGHYHNPAMGTSISWLYLAGANKWFAG